MWRLQRAAKYLTGHARAKIKYEFQEPVQELTLYTDSDWATDLKTRRSLSGGLLFHVKHLLQHWTQFQPVVALSSGEAEVYAAVRGVGNLLGLSNVVTELNPHEKWFLVLCLDATAGKGILLRKGAGSVKHLDVKTLWVQECINSRNIGVQKINREENPANALASSSCVNDLMRHMSTAGLSFD